MVLARSSGKERFMKKCVIVIILALTLLLQGCSSKGENSNSSVKSDVEGQGDFDMAASEEDNVTPQAADAMVPPTQKELVLPVTTNDTGKTLIQTVSGSSSYKYNSYIITSVNGESVVVDPTAMPAVSVVDINPAAIISTHAHPDHVDGVFTGTYDVPKLLYEKGEIQTEDFNIYSIPSSHSGDTITEDGKNVIVVFEVDGLRIAHMGDIGQTTLTKDQLDALGSIDIAFMQFENSYSGMSLDNEKGFKVIEELNPKIVIPTHYTEKSIPIMEEKYGTITNIENLLQISNEDIPETTLNVYMISNTHKYR
jgi:hypothetical protein